MEGISLRPVYGKKVTSSITSTGPPSTSTSTTTSSASPSTATPAIKTSATQKESSIPFTPKSASEALAELDNSDPSKFIYGRGFIKQFQSLCTECPPELQSLFGEVPELKPLYRPPSTTKPSSPQSQTRDTKDIGKQGVGAKPHGKKKQPQEGKKAAAAWNPVFFVDQKEQVLRTIKGTLNKLTPETFGKLSNKIAEMISQITDEEAYQEAVSMVFTKAVGEINFTHMYTQLCVKLHETQAKLTDSQTLFRRILLSQCQQEFEAANVQTDEALLPEDPEEREAVKEKERQRKIGNVKFIGELFNARLLSERIVHECIQSLFKDIIRHKGDKEKVDREFNAELLCKLLSTIGSNLDIPKAKSYMDTYFSHIKKYATDSTSFSSRIRFMCQDLLDLRAYNWVPRRQEVSPKTFSELEAEAAVKEYEEELGIAQQISPRPRPATSTTMVQPEPPKPQSQPQSKPKTAKKKKAKGKSDQMTIEEPVFISSEGEFMEKLIPILEDYLKSEDLKETVDGIRELEAAEYLSKIVEQGISMTIEKHDRERQVMAKLFASLSHDGILKEEHFVKGFKAMVNRIEELQLDIPMVAKFVDQFITAAVSEHCVSKSALSLAGVAAQT